MNYLHLLNNLDLEGEIPQILSNLLLAPGNILMTLCKLLSHVTNHRVDPSCQSIRELSELLHRDSSKVGIEGPIVVGAVSSVLGLVGYVRICSVEALAAYVKFENAVLACNSSPSSASSSSSSSSSSPSSSKVLEVAGLYLDMQRTHISSTF